MFICRIRLTHLSIRRDLIGLWRHSMKLWCSKGAWKQRLFLSLTIALSSQFGLAQSGFQNNWGAFVSPVYNTSESGAYAGAELFAGPNKFGSYFLGVLPNGTKATPVGRVA